MMPPARHTKFRLLWYCVISLACGIAGGYVGEYYTAPFYFGFFLGFVFAGLISMFELAVFIENARNRK